LIAIAAALALAASWSLNCSSQGAAVPGDGAPETL